MLGDGVKWQACCSAPVVKTPVKVPRLSGVKQISVGNQFALAVTAQGRVLLVDNELHRPTIASRIRCVADALGIPRGTVMSRLFYARKRLQAELQDLAPSHAGEV